MPLPSHRISIYKSIGSEEWSNDWLVKCADMDDAADVAEGLLEFEQHMHSSIVTFTYTRISTTIKGDRTFRHVPANVQGLVLFQGAQTLPLFNVMRMDMSTSDSDPARKYFRIPLKEDVQDGGLIGQSTVDAWNSNIQTYLQPIIATLVIVTTKGNTVTNASAYNQVQMRQLERRRRKKLTSIEV